MLAVLDIQANLNGSFNTLTEIARTLLPGAKLVCITHDWAFARHVDKTPRRWFQRAQRACASVGRDVSHVATHLSNHAAPQKASNYSRSVETVTIQELSKATGLSSAALRFYETKGLLVSTARVFGMRVYHADAARYLGSTGNTAVGNDYCCPLD